jgi:hypothetical protein
VREPKDETRPTLDSESIEQINWLSGCDVTRTARAFAVALIAS